MRRVTASGTTLFHLAAVHLGDSAQWWRIADANHLADTDVVGVQTLRIPDVDRAAGDGLPAEDY